MARTKLQAVHLITTTHFDRKRSSLGKHSITMALCCRTLCVVVSLCSVLIGVKYIGLVNKWRIDLPFGVTLLCVTEYWYRYYARYNKYIQDLRSHWSRGLGRGSAAAHWLGLRFPIPSGVRILSLLSVVWFHVQISATVRSVVHRRPPECGVCVWVCASVICVYHLVW
jgi:hypothetical protein